MIIIIIRDCLPNQTPKYYDNIYLQAKISIDESFTSHERNLIINWIIYLCTTSKMIPVHLKFVVIT